MRPRVQPRGSDRIPTNHPSSDLSRCPINSSLARPLAQPSSLHEYLCSKHGLFSWVPSMMDSGIYTNKPHTLIDYTQLTMFR